MDLLTANRHVKHAIRVNIEASLLVGGINAIFVAALLKLPDAIEDLAIGRERQAVHELVDVAYALVQSLYRDLNKEAQERGCRADFLERNRALAAEAIAAAEVDKLDGKRRLLGVVNHLLGALSAAAGEIYLPLPTEP